MFSTQNVQFMLNFTRYSCLSALSTLCSGCRAGSLHVINDRDSRTWKGSRGEAGKHRYNNNNNLLSVNIPKKFNMGSRLSIIFFKNPTWTVHFQLTSTQIQHGQSAFNYFFHKSNMDSLRSVIFYKTPIWTVHFQLISPKIQQVHSAFSQFLHTFSMGCLLSVDFSAISKWVNCLPSIICSTNPTWTPCSKNSTWAACFQLNYAQTQHGSLSFITFCTKSKIDRLSTE